MYTLLLSCSSRSPWARRRAFHANTSSVKCLIVRLGAKYASASTGGGLSLEILPVKDIDDFLTRTCVGCMCSTLSTAGNTCWSSVYIYLRGSVYSALQYSDIPPRAWVQRTEQLWVIALALIDDTTNGAADIIQ